MDFTKENVAIINLGICVSFALFFLLGGALPKPVPELRGFAVNSRITRNETNPFQKVQKVQNLVVGDFVQGCDWTHCQPTRVWWVEHLNVNETKKTTPWYSLQVEGTEDVLILSGKHILPVKQRMTRNISGILLQTHAVKTKVWVAFHEAEDVSVGDFLRHQGAWKKVVNKTECDETVLAQLESVVGIATEMEMLQVNGFDVASYERMRPRVHYGEEDEWITEQESLNPNFTSEVMTAIVVVIFITIPFLHYIFVE